MPENLASNPARKPDRLSGAMGVAAAILVVAGVTGLLYARLGLTETALVKNLLTVETVVFKLQDSYQRPVSNLGLIVAGRKANLAFEIPGRIASLPYRQGSPVQAGDIIAELDDATLLARRKATSADLRQAQAELELARLKAERQKDLRATGAVSKEAFDETRLRARALQARLESVTAQLAGIDIDLQKSRLIAPYAGIIADHYVHEGTVISAGAPVVRVMETTRQEAHIGVAAARAGSLNIGASYTLKLRGARIEAPLLTVRPDVDPITRSTTAVFAIPPGITALDGEPVTLELQENIPLAGGWLPISALLEGQRGVWTVLRVDLRGDQVITVREGVEVLDIQEDRAYVRGTLDGGSSIVASGVHRITPGTAVALQGGD